MWESILNYIQANYPQVFGYLALVLVVGYLTNRATKFYLDTTNRNDEVESMKTLLSKIDKGFTTLNTVLLEKNVINNSLYSGEHSPRTLNEKGKKVFAASGAETLFGARKEEWMRELEEDKYESYLEVERECLNMLLNKMDEPEFSNLQDFAYQHPTFNGDPLAYTDILFVMSLKLRDLYVDRHPELQSRESGE